MKSILKTVKPTVASLPIAFCLAILNLPFFAQELKAEEVKASRVLTVTGRGDRMVPTTKAQIQLGVFAEGKTAQETQNAIASKSSAIIAKLQELKVEQLQTTTINLTPVYQDLKNRQTQVGYSGQITVSFRVPIDQSGTTLDAAVAVGANRIDQISFIAPDSAIREARNLSLQDAVKDAQTQADAVLGVLALKSQSIRNIQVNNSTTNNNNLNVNYLNNGGFARSEVSTPILGGEQRVQTFVTLEISY